MLSKTHVIIFTTIQIIFVSADYQCLCNHNGKSAVYSSINYASRVIGYLYELDCKAVYAQAAKNLTFYQIQFENKVGYVTNGKGIQIHVCAGDVRKEDLVTRTSTSTLPMTSSTTTTRQDKTNVTTLSATVERLTFFNTVSTAHITTQFVKNMTSLKSTVVISSFMATSPTTRSTLSSTASPTTLPSTISSTTVPLTRYSTTTPPSTSRSTSALPSTRPSITMSSSASRSTSALPSAISSTTKSPSITRSTTSLPSTRFSATELPSKSRSSSTSTSTRHSNNMPSSTTPSPLTRSYTTMPHSTIRFTSPPSSTRSSTTIPPSTTRSSTSPSTRSSNIMPLSTTRSTTTLLSTRSSTTISPSTTRSGTTLPSPPSTSKPTTTRTSTVYTTEKPFCPSGWIMYGTSCYLFHTNSQRHWTDANNDCVSKKSHLAIIESVDEFSFIKHQLGSRINTHASESDTAAWIAGRDNNNEGTWEWYDGFTNTYKQINYTKWGHNQPDSGDGDHDEDCMIMVGNDGFKWADYSCNKNMFYVCEQSALHVTAQTQNPIKQLNGQNCPAGWVMDHGSCYFFHTSKRYSWSGANNDCLNKNSHLAEIDTETEFNFLKQQLGQRIDSDIHEDSDTSAWIAGTDNNHEGHWQWYDGFTNTYIPVIYENWGHDEPNSKSGDEDCIAMVAQKSYKWADYDCDTKMFYVCEQSPTLITAQSQYPPQQTNGANCPSEWVQNHDSCYFFHTNSHYTWHDANAYCTRRQAHLAIIETSEEDNFLKQESSQRLHGEQGSSAGLWVAGSDDDYEGHWEWIDGYSHTSKPMQGYTNWHHGEPDSGDGEHDEDCMCMIGGSGAEWQDYKCTKHMYFICEKSTTFAAPLIG